MDKDDYIIKIEETAMDYLYQLEKPIILEFGVRHGLSTKLFLDTCEKNDGFLYSVDIDDNSKKFNLKIGNLYMVEMIIFNWSKALFQKK